MVEVVKIISEQYAVAAPERPAMKEWVRAVVWDYWLKYYRLELVNDGVQETVYRQTVENSIAEYFSAIREKLSTHHHITRITLTREGTTCWCVGEGGTRYALELS